MTQRVLELDGLRGLAATAVVIYHYFYYYDHLYGHSFDVPSWTQYGLYGVHLFFIISGYVIFWTLTRTTQAIDFAVSRFSRLYPTYWCAATLTFGIVSLAGLEGREVALVDYLANLTMIHEFIGFPHVDGVYWTLTLELAFYAWMGLLYTTRQLGRVEIWLTAWVFVAAILNSHHVALEIPGIVERATLLKYINFFAIGVCLYKIHTSCMTLQTWILLATAFLGIYTRFPNDIVIGLIAMVLLVHIILSGRIKIFSSRPLVLLGTISYALYLIHQNMGYVLIQTGYRHDLHASLTIGATMIVAMALAAALTYGVEKPALRLVRMHWAIQRQRNSSSQRLPTESPER